MTKRRRRLSPIKRFWRNVHKDPNGCWIWQRAKKPKGYGIVHIFGRTQLAARVAYRLEVGPIGEGLSVCHRCDNPACVRPDHLFLGTNRQNVDDAIRKGRFKGGVRKLSDADLATIAERLRAGVSKHQIAREYGIDRSALRWHERRGRFDLTPG